jgi:hypothetical protein
MPAHFSEKGFRQLFVRAYARIDAIETFLALLAPDTHYQQLTTPSFVALLAPVHGKAQCT